MPYGLTDRHELAASTRVGVHDELFASAPDHGVRRLMGPGIGLHGILGQIASADQSREERPHHLALLHLHEGGQMNEGEEGHGTGVVRTDETRLPSGHTRDRASLHTVHDDDDVDLVIVTVGLVAELLLGQLLPKNRVLQQSGGTAHEDARDRTAVAPATIEGQEGIGSQDPLQLVQHDRVPAQQSGAIHGRVTTAEDTVDVGEDVSALRQRLGVDVGQIRHDGVEIGAEDLAEPRALDDRWRRADVHVRRLLDDPVSRGESTRHVADVTLGGPDKAVPLLGQVTLAVQLLADDLGCEPRGIASQATEEGVPLLGQDELAAGLVVGHDATDEVTRVLLRADVQFRLALDPLPHRGLAVLVLDSGLHTKSNVAQVPNDVENRIDDLLQPEDLLRQFH